MSIFLISIYASFLFFILSPTILFRIPSKNSKYVVAAVHAVIFGLIFYFTYKLIPQDYKEGYKEGASTGLALQSYNNQQVEEKEAKEKVKQKIANQFNADKVMPPPPNPTNDIKLNFEVNQNLKGKDKKIRCDNLKRGYKEIFRYKQPRESEGCPDHLDYYMTHDKDDGQLIQCRHDKWRKGGDHLTLENRNKFYNQFGNCPLSSYADKV
jgi:hypothetical protein